MSDADPFQGTAPSAGAPMAVAAAAPPILGAFDAGTVDLLGERARQIAGSSTPVPSPCISVCRMDAGSGLCLGCLRSIEEICDWSAMDEQARRAVWRLIDQRGSAAI